MLTLLGCCLIHLAIGSIYAASVLYTPIVQQTGWEPMVPLTGFCVTILFLGLFAAFADKLTQGRTRPESVRVAAVSYAVSQVFWWLSLDMTSMSTFLLSSVLAGMSLGILYSYGIAEAISLTDTKKGLYSGLVVTCFGLGSLFAAKAYSLLIPQGLYAAFSYTLFTLLILGIGSALVRGFKGPSRTSVGVFVKDPLWLKLYIVFFLNILVGLTLLTNYRGYSELRNFTPEDAIFLVGIAGFFNAGGRIVFSSLSDFFGRLQVFQLVLVLQTIILAFLPFQWTLSLVLVATYGAGFALMPSICTDLFENGSAAYGALLSAWGLAAILAAMIAINIPDPFPLLLFLSAGCLCLILYIRKELSHVNR